jgi:hypothetical protein
MNIHSCKLFDIAKIYVVESVFEINKFRTHLFIGGVPLDCLAFALSLRVNSAPFEFFF